MKSLIKVTLLAATIGTLLNVPAAFAAPQTKSDTAPALDKAFKTEEQKTAYALGASLGRSMNYSLQAQSKIGINLDKKTVLDGLQDALDDKSKLSDDTIASTLKTFDGHIKEAIQQQKEKMTTENGKKGDDFRGKFAKEAGVKKTSSGLLYKIEKEGTGAFPQSTDTVVVNYAGTLTDGTEFDSSYKRKEPLSIRLDSVIPGWTEGLQLIKKGGKIKMVLPPDLAYGEDGIPDHPNATLIFDVELLDIKPTTDAEKPATAPATQTSKDKK